MNPDPDRRRATRLLAIAIIIALLLPGCTSSRHAAQRLADATAYTTHAQEALEQGRTADAQTHLRSAQIQHGAALGALGYTYDPEAAPVVPAKEQ